MTIKTHTESSKTELSSRGKRPFKVWRFFSKFVHKFPQNRNPILRKTIYLRSVESDIAKSLSIIQENNRDVDIGSYPFFRAGKLGVSIVLRSTEQIKIDKSNMEIIKFVKEKNIEVIENE